MIYHKRNKIKEGIAIYKYFKIDRHIPEDITEQFKMVERVQGRGGAQWTADDFYWLLAQFDSYNKCFIKNEFIRKLE